MSEMSKPLISVIMPVFNAEQYLREAIDSILKQSIKDIELILINDCSTDGSLEIINSYHDDRIVLIQNQINCGVSVSLNKGLDIARGKYIARMDSDDISLPYRFEKQWQFMEQHKEVVLISCSMEYFGSASGIHEAICGHDEIMVTLLFHSVIAHPGFFMRGDVVRRHHLRYNEKNQYAEDYEFQIDIAQYGKLDNISEVLFQYRVHAASVSREHSKIQMNSTNIVRKKLIEKMQIEIPKDIEMKFMQSMQLKYNYEFTLKEYYKIKRLYDQMIEQNKQFKFYNQKILEQKLYANLKLCRKQLYIIRLLKKKVKKF